METMESSTVAKLVEYFNNVSIIALALFAAFGIIAIFWRKGLRVNTSGGKAKKSDNKSGYTLLSVFCVAALAAFAAEVTFFNYQPYLKIFAGPELETTEISPENPNALLTTSGGVVAEILMEADEKTNINSGGVLFKGLNMNVTSIIVNVEFNNVKTGDMTVTWTDGLSNSNKFTKKLYKQLPRDYYAPLQPYGKVSELKIMFTGSKAGGSINIKSIALNKQIPFYFSGLRLIVATFVFFAIICLLREGPRAKAAYYLFEYKFNPANRKQSLTFALTIILLVLFSYICINTSYSKAYLEYPVHQQYNKFLVDALLKGRTWLDYGTPENLLKAERPYDNSYRIANGYKFNSDVMWDWAWYKGKFYCYYGIVPAVILYLPYKLITGEYLSNNGGISVFTSAIIILMALLWRFCVKKYMPNCGFVFFMLSFLALFFASGISAQLRFPRFYSIVQTAGLMFALAGCLLLLKSVENENVNRLKLFFACLCLALIAGCRPNMIFVSLLVPVVLWKYRSWKLFSFVAIPYVIVAIPLCVYNYVRFDSIFEFGNKLVLTGYNFGEGTELIVPFGKFIKIFRDFAYYLLVPGKYSLSFPFVEGYPLQDEYVMGMLYLQMSGLGMVNFPIVFCVLYLLFNGILNKKYAAQYLLWWFIVIAVIIIIIDSLMIGFQGRFLLDFATFIVLPSLFCAYYFVYGNSAIDSMLQNKNRLIIVHCLLAVSIFVGLFLCVTGMFVAGTGVQVEYNAVLYRYLECSLGIFRNL